MKKLFKKKLFITGIIIVFVVIGAYFLFRPKAPTYTFVEAKKETLTQEVSVTGHVKPESDADLAFDVSGKVSWINAEVGSHVAVGQSLVQLSNGDVRARLEEAEAALSNQQIKLTEIQKGTRPEELQVYETKVRNAEAALADAKINLRDKVQDAFTKSDDSVRSKADKFFNNARTSDPQFNLTLGDSQIKTDLNSSRVNLETMLTSWEISLMTDKENSVLAKNNTTQVGTFLDKLAFAINSVTPSYSLTQTTIDGYKADIYSARTNISSALSGLTSAESSVKTASSNLELAQKELDLQRAGATTEQIASQITLVAQAQANVNNYKAQLGKTILYSPIGGVVTKQDAKVGEIIQAGKIIVSVISLNKFKIETDIPEADIAKISLNDNAKITLDAYGDEVIFDAKVIKMDPAETIVEGVSTYKVTLEFNTADERIRSGMTANIDILTEQKNDVIAIPQRAIIEEGTRKLVKILQDNKTIKEVTIKTGLKGSNGNIEITEGINAGEKVITSIKN